MDNSPDLSDIREEEMASFIAFQGKAVGTNINEATLLATDYLNHFNEIVMTLEMVPDMPELLEDAREWQPKSYQTHMLDSSFSDKELAVEAYNHVPKKYREPFEQTIAQIDLLIATTIDRQEKELETGNMDLLRENTQTILKTIQHLMDIASGIIHGSAKTMDHSEIDVLIG